ncbi:hypothetical protein Airi02_100740 [Actinoallomurus iriomotensis]|uniref:Uncharacterized protein n=1 Tax=Actinoallomurus iriomotensis TaxID=478107 RepID=A0A9W6SEK1_9ACTN|nr:hypothetical protein Airi02_100740 [Actinoallomurus iriomotensis]
MTVEDPTIVDQVTRSEDGTRYTLVMVEPRPLAMSDEQVRQITEKINRYIEIIVSGELYEKFPHARGKEIAVRLICMDEPDHPRMTELLDVAAEVFLKNGIDFAVQIVPRELLEGRKDDS